MPAIQAITRDEGLRDDLKILRSRTPRLTAQEIAKRLGVSRATYYRLVAELEVRQ